MRTSIRLVLASAILGLTVTSSGSPGLRAAQQPEQPSTARGQTATVLSDGSVLLLGGEGRPAQASLYDPRTHTTRALGGLRTPRAWHTATVLPDGTVLVVGGVGADGQILQDVEGFDPATGQFQAMREIAVTARAHHTATLLTDGRILFAGGDTPGGGGVPTELWDVRTNATDAVPTPPDIDRADGVAQLLPDGRVRITGGRARGRRAARSADVFDPEAMAFVDGTLAPPDAAPSADGIVAVLPADGATGVSHDVQIALRLSTPIDARSVVVALEQLDGPAAVALPVTVVSAEGGRLVFVTPASTLPSDSDFRVTLRSARTVSGGPLPVFSSAFRTARPPDPARAVDHAGRSIRRWTSRPGLPMAEAAVAPGASGRDRVGGSGAVAERRAAGGRYAGDRRTGGPDGSHRPLPAAVGIRAVRMERTAN